jgi:hypothetical protein
MTDKIKRAFGEVKDKRIHLNKVSFDL